MKKPALSADARRRNAQIARITLLAKEASLTESEMRDAMIEVTGKMSRAALEEGERVKFIDYLARLARAERAKHQDKQLAKLEAVWGELHAAGKVQVNSRAAMQAWALRHYPSVAKLEWMDGSRLTKLIEMAKRWRDRQADAKEQR